MVSLKGSSGDLERMLVETDFSVAIMIWVRLISSKRASSRGFCSILNFLSTVLRSLEFNLLSDVLARVGESLSSFFVPLKENFNLYFIVL